MECDTVNQVGQIIILNGTPRSGKTSIAHVIRESFVGLWVNIGVDPFKQHVHAQRISPGIGLRPGGERPELEPAITVLYAAMYESVAAHSRLGVNVVVDVGHHDSYSKPRGILADSARRLEGLPVLFVGVRCPIDVIMERWAKTWGNRKAGTDSIPEPVQRFQREVHRPGVYDLEVDTSQLSPEECAESIRQRLDAGPMATAFHRLAAIPALEEAPRTATKGKHSPDTGALSQSIRRVMKHLIQHNAVTSRADGKRHPVFPVALGPREAEWLREWIRREKPLRTLEIGLGYGVSALHICEGLLLNGNHADKHTVIDPHQNWRFSQIGLQLLEDATVRDLVEHLDEESQTALPRFLQQQRCFDFAFVDGNHHFDYVFLDLFYLGRLLRKGSVVVLDDYDWPGVRKAVSFCVTNLNWVIEGTFSNSVAVRTPLTSDKRPGRFLAEF